MVSFHWKKFDTNENFSNKVLRKLRTYSNDGALWRNIFTEMKRKWKTRQAISFEPDGIISLFSSLFFLFSVVRRMFNTLKVIWNCELWSCLEIRALVRRNDNVDWQVLKRWQNLELSADERQNKSRIRSSEWECISKMSSGILGGKMCQVISRQFSHIFLVCCCWWKISSFPLNMNFDRYISTGTEKLFLQLDFNSD